MHRFLIRLIKASPIACSPQSAAATQPKNGNLNLRSEPPIILVRPELCARCGAGLVPEPHRPALHGATTPGWRGRRAIWSTTAHRGCSATGPDPHCREPLGSGCAHTAWSWTQGIGSTNGRGVSSTTAALLKEEGRIQK